MLQNRFGGMGIRSYRAELEAGFSIGKALGTEILAGSLIGGTGDAPFHGTPVPSREY